MSKSCSPITRGDEDSDSSVDESAACETFKWVALDIEKDVNCALFPKLEWEDRRWGGFGVRNLRHRKLSQRVEKFPDKFWGLRTTLLVGKHAVPIIWNSSLQLGEVVDLVLLSMFLGFYGLNWNAHSALHNGRLEIRERLCETNWLVDKVASENYFCTLFIIILL